MTPKLPVIAAISLSAAFKGGAADRVSRHNPFAPDLGSFPAIIPRLPLRGKSGRFANTGDSI